MSDVQSETRAFGLVKTLLVNDNIASRVVDVLVNAANDRLHMGGGVAAALRSKGGIEIHQEAIRQGPAARPAAGGKDVFSPLLRGSPLAPRGSMLRQRR